MTAIPARKPPIAQPERNPAGSRRKHVAADLDDDLERGSRSGPEEEHRQDVVRDEAADPGAEDRRPAGDEGQQREPRPGQRHTLVGRRRGDPESLRDVVNHEADDQERAERELAEGERRPDREPLAEVVDADPDRHEQRERRTAHHPTAARGRETGRKEGHRQVAQGDAEQHEPGPAERARHRRLQRERLEKGLDAEEREQSGGQRHERRQPLLARAPQRRQPEEAERRPAGRRRGSR